MFILLVRGQKRWLFGYFLGAFVCRYVRMKPQLSDIKEQSSSAVSATTFDKTRTNLQYLGSKLPAFSF